MLHVHRDNTVEGPEEARHLVRGPKGHELAPGRLQVQDESQGHDHVPGRLQVTVTSGTTPKGADTLVRSRSHRHGGLRTNSNTGARNLKPASSRRRCTRSTRRTRPRPAPPHEPPESMRARPGGHSRAQTGGCLRTFLTRGKVRKTPSPRSSRDAADELEPPGSGRSCKPPP